MCNNYLKYDSLRSVSKIEKKIQKIYKFEKNLLIKNITNFKKDAYAFGYDAQLYIYCKLFNVHYKEFWFIAIDKGSLDIGIYDCSKEFYESGRQQVQKVLDTYKTKMQDKSEEDIKDFIDNYYFSGSL